MIRTSLWALLMLLVPAMAWAGPASRPTLKSAIPMSEPASRPAIDLEDLQREWDATLRHVVRARFDAGDRFDATPAGKAAKAEVAAKHRALEEARALGSPEDRLEASSAYNKARAARDAARDAGVAADPDVLRALASADRAKAELDRGKAALGISDAPKSASVPAPPAPVIRAEYRVESSKTFGGMRTMKVTFTVVADAQQVESVLRTELMSSIDKDPPGGDIIIHALDDNGNNLTTPDGSSGMVFIQSEGQIVTLKNWAAHKRR
jgi:hypothetical protein